VTERAITERTIPLGETARFGRKVFALVLSILIGRSGLCRKVVNVTIQYSFRSEEVVDVS
jgi:hypothetical protein